MAGLLEAGGAIDNVFDVVRGDIGKADTTIQAWFHDQLHQDSSRYDIQSVLYWYSDGIKNGRFQQFGGINDPEAQAITSDIANRSGLAPSFVYNVVFALRETSANDAACARILSGGGGNIFDSVMNAGVTKTISDTVNDGLNALGLPSIGNTLIIVIVIAIVVFVVYLKVKK